MKRRILFIVTAVLELCFFCHCDTGPSNDSISTDPVTIAAGASLFSQACSGCHNFRQDGIGPQLRGLTSNVSAEWIQEFIENPQGMISSGNERAVQLFNKYKSVMPSFPTLKENDTKAIIAFLHTYKLTAGERKGSYGKEISNPIADSIEFSGLEVELKTVTQIPASSKNGKLPSARITKLASQPVTGDLFILDLRGKLYRLQNNEAVVYMDMSKLKMAFIHEPGLATGFGSFAFHPDFKTNGLLYTTHTESPASGKADFGYADSIKVTLQWVLTEWKTKKGQDAVFSGTSRELLRVNMVTGLHGVQEITFNPLSKPGNEDYGLLYIGVGDGGSVENGYPFLVHNTENIWGTILRIDPMGRNSINGQYGIPKNNPFVQDQNPRTSREIYAFGFRNPHRITWTSSGEMLASNIGHGDIESLNIVIPGGDYGWPIREGPFLVHPDDDLNKVYPLPENDSTYKITYPVALYDHDEGKAISGGFEYGGKAIPALKGKFLFGDIPTGRLFYVNIDEIKKGKQAPIKEWKISLNNTPASLVDICKNKRVDLHFGIDAQGEMYLFTKADGKVYKLQRAKLK